MAVSPTSLPSEAAVPEPSPELLARAAAVRRAATGLAQTSDAERRGALLAMADALDADRQAERVGSGSGCDLLGLRQLAMRGRGRVDDQGQLTGIRIGGHNLVSQAGTKKSCFSL